jgi:hypothetical protein
MLKWLFAFVLLAHGAVHVMGFVGATGIGQLENISGTPSIIFTELSAGDPLLIAFGALWLIAMLGFMASAVGVVTNQPWWPAATIASVVISSLVVALWWTDAWVGSLLNVGILAVVAWQVTRRRRVHA